MIHRIYASDKRFKPVVFHAGLNVILADKKQDSDEKDSRNGLGKTTLLRIMHFCLGSDLNKNILPVDEINDWSFYIEIDLAGVKITGSRSIENAGIVKVEGNTNKLPLAPEKDEKEGFSFYTLVDWKKLLGICLFGLGSTKRTKYTPSYRGLISYFIRTGVDAYSKPFNYFRSQSAWSAQVHNAFLLGLNWDHAAEAQELKDKSKAITSLNSAIKTGIVSSQGELEAERVGLQKEIDQEKASLSSFKVYPQYQELQSEANSITKEIHEYSNKNLILHRKLDRYEDSIRAEQAPDDTAVSDLYEEAGLHFGDALKKSLDDAKNFHNKVVENRRFFLQAEVDEIKSEIAGNERNIKENTIKRAEILEILSTHGALDEFTVLQERLIEKKGKLESVKSKIADIKDMSLRRQEVKEDKIELESKIQRDYEQTRPQWEKTVAGFSENSQALYNESGNLIINYSDNGYSFDVEIPRSNSEGVGKMKIFCYDLMLVEQFSDKGLINFLVHDSTLFDGVDARQTAFALELAHKKAIDNGFQYICAFNSDMLPMEEFSEDFDVQKYVRLKLDDKEPGDSLLGFRY